MPVGWLEFAAPRTAVTGPEVAPRHFAVAGPPVLLMLTLIESETDQVIFARAPAPIVQLPEGPVGEAMNCCEVPTDTAADGGETLRAVMVQEPPLHVTRTNESARTQADIKRRFAILALRRQFSVWIGAVSTG